jgi:hypothetical protein
MPFNFRRNPLKISTSRVLVLNFRPAATPKEWRDTKSLVEEYVEAMIQASQKLLAYRVVTMLDIPKYPMLMGGRQYNDITWPQVLTDDKKALRDEKGNYALADYMRIITDYQILQGIEKNVIDEVWMFGGPYFGFYESRMVGKGAFWCNAPAIELPGRRFVMMGFNYQRGSQEMIHSFGHRAESILSQKFNAFEFQNKLYNQQATPQPKNDYEQWLLQHGTVHYTPGGANYSQNEFSWVSAIKPEWWPYVVNPNKV